MGTHAFIAVTFGVAAALAVRFERLKARRRERNAFELGRDAERLLLSPTPAGGC